MKKIFLSSLIFLCGCNPSIQTPSVIFSPFLSSIYKTCDITIKKDSINLISALNWSNDSNKIYFMHTISKNNKIDSNLYSIDINNFNLTKVKTIFSFDTKKIYADYNEYKKHQTYYDDYIKSINSYKDLRYLKINIDENNNMKYSSSYNFPEDFLPKSINLDLSNKAENFISDYNSKLTPSIYNTSYEISYETSYNFKYLISKKIISQTLSTYQIQLKDLNTGKKLLLEIDKLNQILNKEDLSNSIVSFLENTDNKIILTLNNSSTNKYIYGDIDLKTNKITNLSYLNNSNKTEINEILSLKNENLYYTLKNIKNYLYTINIKEKNSSPKILINFNDFYQEKNNFMSDHEIIISKNNKYAISYINNLDYSLDRKIKIMDIEKNILLKEFDFKSLNNEEKFDSFNIPYCSN